LGDLPAYADVGFWAAVLDLGLASSDVAVEKISP
jgi:hypothetical protein